MQPDPIPNDTRPVWELVIEDMKARDRLGRERYGTPLQVGNGRDSLRDAYEEALDQSAYLKQAIVERDQLLAENAKHEQELADLTKEILATRRSYLDYRDRFGKELEQNRQLWGENEKLAASLSTLVRHLTDGTVMVGIVAGLNLDQSLATARELIKEHAKRKAGA